jgi:HAD superfamily hydrolase (TIGR01509 family)
VIGAVLFDGDQTLWDFQRVMTFALEAALVELRTARPGPITAAVSIADFRADRDAVAQELAGIEFNLSRLRQLGFARTLERLVPGDPDGNGPLADQLTATYFHHRDLDPALFEDTLPCLDALAPQYRMGLLSNGSRLPQTIGLAHYFETVVFAQDHQVAKPDRGLFQVVEQRLDVDPDYCVLVGDHPLNDVVGAKRSGWRAVWVDRDGDGEYVCPDGCDEEPDAVVTSLAQLPEVLRAW